MSLLSIISRRNKSLLHYISKGIDFYLESQFYFVRESRSNFPRPSENPRNIRKEASMIPPLEQRWYAKWNATSFPFIPRPLPHWSVPQLVAIKRTPQRSQRRKRSLSDSSDTRRMRHRDDSRKRGGWVHLRNFQRGGMNKESRPPRGAFPPLPSSSPCQFDREQA